MRRSPATSGSRCGALSGSSALGGLPGWRPFQAPAPKRGPVRQPWIMDRDRASAVGAGTAGHH